MTCEKIYTILKKPITTDEMAVEIEKIHLAEVARIVEPLYRKCPENIDYDEQAKFVIDCIEETVKRANVGNNEKME